MVDRIRVGDQGYALVVAANGQLIAHGNSNEKPRVARGDNLATQPLVRLVHGQHNAGPASLEVPSPGFASSRAMRRRIS